MNHDDLGNYSHSYVADLRAQLQAANERAEKAEEINHRLTTMCRAYSVDPAKIGNTEIAITRIAQDEHMALLNRLAASQQTSAALKAEVDRLLHERNEIAEKSVLPYRDQLNALVREAEKVVVERDAALALNDTLAGALKRSRDAIGAGFGKEQRAHIEQQAAAALSAYAKSKEAQP